MRREIFCTSMFPNLSLVVVLVFNVDGTTPSTGASKGAFRPSAGSRLSRSTARDPATSQARHDGAAPRRSVALCDASLTRTQWGFLAAKSVRAAHRRAEPLDAPGATSELSFLPPRLRPPGSHSPSRTGSERVNLWSPGEEFKQWVSFFCLLAVV